MATITSTNMQGSGERSVTTTTLDGSSDTFTYNRNLRPVLILHNPTGGPITPTIDGDGASEVLVAGVGDIDISAGYTPESAIAAGATIAIPLQSIGKYLAGTIAVTGGSGLEAQLLEF